MELKVLKNLKEELEYLEEAEFLLCLICDAVSHCELFNFLENKISSEDLFKLHNGLEHHFNLVVPD